MPAAAVIRRWQALSGFIGFKGCVGGFLSRWLKVAAQLFYMPSKLKSLSYQEAGGISGVAVKCIDTRRNTYCEGSLLDILTLMHESVGIKQD